LIVHRWGAVAAVFVFAAASCSGGGGGRRVVRVDFQQDEFASYYWRFFPRTVEAHPGDTVEFDQQWTGEPHTVTMGALVDRAITREQALEKKYNSPIVIDGKRYDSLDQYQARVSPEAAKAVVRRADREFTDAMGGVPSFDSESGAAAQNAEQPCYLDTGTPPADPNKPCAKRSQPAFDGKASYYSSGFIPPSGPSGNTFRVKLAKHIAPGTYRYFCLIHFPFMQGSLDVKPTGTKLPSQAEVNARATKEIEALAAPLRTSFAQLKSGRAEIAGQKIPLPMGGYHSESEFTVALLEFVPRAITTRVGRPVTWSLRGAHTVSFGVPRFVPIYFVSKDGTVRRNPVVDRAAGGSPPAPPVDYNHAAYRIDGGTYSGSGFYSSGLLGSDPYSQYTLRFAKPGTYRYACLVHPKMVGTLVVQP
jgi:plastocyanin